MTNFTKWQVTTKCDNIEILTNIKTNKFKQISKHKNSIAFDGILKYLSLKYHFVISLSFCIFLYILNLVYLLVTNLWQNFSFIKWDLKADLF